MGPLAGLGDAIVQALLPTVTGAIAGYRALEDSCFGLILAMVVYVALWLVFWYLSYPVYESGVSFITDKASSLIWVLIVVAIALGALGIREPLPLN